MEAMSEFLALLPPQQAVELFLSHVARLDRPERVATVDAFGRIAHADVAAPFSLPSFVRSTVDGYAVLAASTFGATDSLPAFLRVVSEVAMGERATTSLEVGDAALIHTGGMLPNGSDAVVMVEWTEQASGQEIEVRRAVGVGENVLQVGEDVRKGDVVIAAGERLGSAEIGGLMALGQTQVAVAKRPTVGILSSGDEVRAPAEPLAPGQIYDVNSYSLATLIETVGGRPQTYPIIADNPEAFRRSAESALADNDVVLFTAGSSVSVRDLTAQTIDQLGAPGVLVHGINIRPGKPTILAMCNGKPVVGLPGNPVSALVVARRIVRPLIQQLLGANPRVVPQLSATLTTNLASQSGREEWVPVRLIEQDGTRLAEPVFGKSNLIFTLARAHGLLCIAPEATGLAAGTAVEVELL